MEKEFVPFELAVKLKELGFSSHSYFGGWDSDIKWHWHPDSDIILDAPLWQQAFDWFRLNEGYDVVIKKNGLISYKGELLGDYANPISIEPNTYEEVRCSCLEKLIEIVTNKS